MSTADRYIRRVDINDAYVPDRRRAPGTVYIDPYTRKKKVNPLPNPFHPECIQYEFEFIDRVKLDRERSIEKYLDEVSERDHEERLLRRNNYRSDFETKNLFLTWVGEPTIDRFWCSRTPYEVDGTVYTPGYWGPGGSEHLIFDDWYTEPVGTFREVVSLLTRHATEREYGRVFFSTETRYVST